MASSAWRNSASPSKPASQQATPKLQVTAPIEVAYDALIAAGVQPENENGKALTRDNLQSPSGTRILWLPKRFGHFSIELLEEKELEAFIQAAFTGEK